MSGEYSEDILVGLTDEERAALNEDAGGGDEGGAGAGGGDDDDANKSGADDGAKSGAGDDANKGGADDANKNAVADDAAKSKTDDAAAAAAAAAGDDASKQVKTDDAPADTKQPIVPLLVAEAPADAEAKLAEITTKKATLVDQFDNGDITAKEYQTQLDALNKDERAIERAVDKAQTATEMRQQQEMNAWLGEVNSFTHKAHPEYSTSRARWMALDTFVKEIGSDPSNASLSGQQILAKAHEMVVADLGDAPAKPADDKGKPADGKPADGKTAKPLKGAKIDPPPTLGKVPASDNADVENGRWAALDRLQESDPEAHEERMMKLSKDERDEYLASRA